MPETPEVEITARRLSSGLAGAEVESALAPGMVTMKSVDPPLAALEGRSIEKVRRIGKMPVVEFGAGSDGRLELLVHLMSAGRLQAFDKRASLRDRRSRLLIRLADGRELRLREFGTKQRAWAKLLREKREALVREHMESENRHEFDATLATFDHPRYELIATGEVYDGPEEVSAYYDETRAAFPDQHNEVIAVHHADDAVLVEAWVRGTHVGSYRGLPPTGRQWEIQILAAFMFEGDRLLCERVYFDSNTVREQLGIAHDPDSLAGRVSTVFNHPITIGQAMVRRLTRR